VNLRSVVVAVAVLVAAVSLTGTFGSTRKEVFALRCLADTPREFGGSHPGDDQA
jgi:hypothetical protein